jgi:segregation and condensation protein B
MNASPARSTQKMTLRRFVRVTFDNLRELIQTIAAPTTNLPVPTLITPPRTNGAETEDSQPQPAGPTPMETDTFGGDTLGTDSVGGDSFGEKTVGSQELGLETRGGATADTEAAAILPAEIEEDEEAVGDEKAPEDEEAAADGEGIEVEEPIADAKPAAIALPLAAALESLLFVSDEAVEPAQLARALAIVPAEVEAGLQALDAAYREGSRGLRLQTRNGRYQLVTAPEAANLIEMFLNLDTTTRLSAPALETLAVVAYRQPVTRAQIEAVRGVDCSGVLRSLLQRGLLEEVGRLDAPGRPVLYGVTDLFMHHFGLTALHELPPLENAELARIEDALEQQA